MTDLPQYDTFDKLVAGIGALAMEAIHLNKNAYTVNTVEGAYAAFDERIMVLLHDVGYCEILKLMSDAPMTAHLQLPKFNVTRLEEAVLFTVASRIRSIHGIAVLDHCFQWAEGKFLTTMERCADVAEKIDSHRHSRDMMKGAKSIRHLLTRFDNERKIPDDFNAGSFAFEIKSLFEPATNDRKLDWLSLNAIGIDRPLLFELIERMQNYSGLSEFDPWRFEKLVADEISACQ